MKGALITIACGSVMSPVPAAHGTADPARGAWSRSNADDANTRYSALRQIDRLNVARLRVAWVYRSGDGRGNVQANPVIVDGVIFAPTAGKAIVALDGATGAERWRFRPSQPEGVQEIAGGYGPAQRGLTYWPGDGMNRPRLFFVSEGRLVALDPQRGAIVESFGERGYASLTRGGGGLPPVAAVAPAISGDVIVAPNKDVVDAFDLLTGKRLWQFNVIQYPVKDPNADNGGNVWGGMAMDAKRGIAFVATGDPHPNFVGIDRPGNNPHTNSVLALDVKTGRLLWSFQEVAHSIWDLDIPAPPNLVTVVHAGKRVDAVAQVTKLGNTLLLDRLTGKPLFPYRTRRAPSSKLPGEKTAPHQPDLQWPQPFARQVFTPDDITNLTPSARAFVMKQVGSANLGWFAPFEEGKPTVFFGVRGGAEWTGAAFDPVSGSLYVSANEIPSIVTVSRQPQVRPDKDGKQTPGGMVYLRSCAVCHGENREGKGMIPSLIGVHQRTTAAEADQIVRVGRAGMPPVALEAAERRAVLDFLFTPEPPGKAKPAGDRDSSRDAAYVANGFPKLLDDRGYPGSKPPWGTLNAIDLNTGRLRWKVPLGEYAKLTREGVPQTGMQNFGGAMVTAGGLVFCAGTSDQKIRAFDATDGRELWEHELPFGGYAPPATYEIDGTQYVVIAATGGGKLGGTTGDAYVAFALPESR